LYDTANPSPPKRKEQLEKDRQKGERAFNLADIFRNVTFLIYDVL